MISSRPPHGGRSANAGAITLPRATDLGRYLQNASLVLGLFIGCLGLILAQSDHLRVSAADTRSKGTGDTMSEAKRLIGALANHNPAPNLVGDEMGKAAVFDKKYDWAEQTRVHKLITELSAHAEETWADLVDSMDDKRYAITYQAVNSGYNRSVGDVCKDIILDWLVAGYVPHVPPTARASGQARAMRTAVVGYRRVKEWCLQRKSKKLYELQIEMCEKSMGWIQRLRAPEKEKRASIQAIRAEIKSLQAGKMPRAPEGFRAGMPVRLYPPRR